jgi:hypothetical protein
MAENRRSDSEPEPAARSRAPETTSAAKADTDKSEPAAKADTTKSEPAKANADKAGAGAADTAQPDDKKNGGPVETRPKGGNGKPAVRGLATEMPVKIDPPKELAEYVVSVNNKTGLVVKIEALTGAGERKELSQAEYARVAAQLSSAARPLAAAMSAQAAAAVPQMLNAPAFNALAARAAAMPPALAQLARGGAAPEAIAGGAPVAASVTIAAQVAAQMAADTTAVTQAYFQGVIDYLNALATVR